MKPPKKKREEGDIDKLYPPIPLSFNSKCPYTNGKHLIDYNSGSYREVCRKCGLVLT